MAAKKTRNLRKRKSDEADGPAEAEADTAIGLKELLEETKRLQRQRDRRAGLDAASLLGSAEDRVYQEATTLQQGAQNELMGAYVKEQTRDDLEMDPEMEKYIESQLAKRLGKRRKSEGEGEDAEGDDARTEEDDLYNIPDNLKGQKTKQQDVSAWMTGIQEVQLPMDFKLKNIEETEAAKKRLLASAGAGPGRTATAEEEEEEEARRHAPRGVHRAVFPRDFGRQNAKDVERRVETVLASQVEKPSWREKKKPKARRPGG